jgi:hypothetical protein
MEGVMKSFIVGIMMVTTTAIFTSPGCLTTADQHRYSNHPLRLAGTCNCPCEKGFKLSHHQGVCPECRHKRYAKLPIVVSKKNPIRRQEPFATQDAMNAYSSGKNPVDLLKQYVAQKVTNRNMGE